MKYLKTKLCLAKLLLLLAAGLASVSVHAQSVQKLADFFAGQDGDGNGIGANTPQCHFTQIGTNLWFTSNLGGGAGFGAVFIFNPFENNVTQVATLSDGTGTKPQSSSIMVASGKGWFTTSANAAGAKGSLCSIDLTNYTVNNVFSFPTSGPLGSAPHSTPVQIGNDLWFTTSGGGVAPDGGTTYGTVVKYNLTDGTLSNMFTLDNTNWGKQLLGNSLVPAGGAYYFLTFAGGTNVITGVTPTGAGVLNKLSFNASNQPALSKVADLPSHFVCFPAGDPVYDGTNFIYFTTVGVTTNPGAIVRFNLANSNLTTLCTFITNAVATTNFGKQPYGTPVLYNNELYYTTLAGGTAGKGMLGKLSLSNNVITKLADFEGTAGLALGASPQYNGGTVFTNPVDGRIGIYFPIDKGGANNLGTIVRVAMPAPPIVATLQPLNGALQLSWTGGYSPFSVDAKLASFTGDWTTNWVAGLATNSLTLPAGAAEAYFRVQGTNQ